MTEQVSSVGVPERAEPGRRNWTRTIGNVLASTIMLATTTSGDRDPADFARDLESTAVHELPADPQQLDAKQHPNVVFILADDLDWSLMPYMPHVNHLIGDAGAKLALEDEQSLCCTSRSSILTGMYAHNTRVVGNAYPWGGYVAFHKYDEKHALPVWLNNSGYDTSLLGKYLNQYPAPATNLHAGVSPDFVPPGFDYFVAPIAGDPYTQFAYELNVNSTVDQRMRQRFMGDVIADMAIKHLQQIPNNLPFFAEISLYSPHSPYSYPKRLENTFNNVHYPRTPAFHEKNIRDKVYPLHDAPRLTKQEKQVIDEAFRDRVRAVQTIDSTVARLVRALRSQSKLDNTYIIFGSDNGYFMGEHRRDIGKYDQFQTSLSVPYYVRGPGIQPGTDLRDTLLASNIDVAPTIADMANIAVKHSVDGLSLLPVLQGKTTELARNHLLIGRGSIPTYRQAPSGLEEPPEPRAVSRKGGMLDDFLGVYGNVKDKRYKYVVFTNGGNSDHPREELYDEAKDPFELRNLLGAFGQNVDKLTKRQHRAYEDMKAALPKLLVCAGANCNF
jgi:arylsulfatase A-like enzyme